MTFEWVVYVAGNKALSKNRDSGGVWEAFVGHWERREPASEEEQGRTAQTAVDREGHLSQRGQTARRQPFDLATALLMTSSGAHYVRQSRLLLASDADTERI